MSSTASSSASASSSGSPLVTSASGSALVSTLVPALIIGALWFGFFIILRKTQHRSYAPRTYLGSIREEERTPALPNGLFNWFFAFSKVPDLWALQHQSLDAYLFLRFLRLLVVIMVVGCMITWPILFPLNATGHSSNPLGQQIGMLSMSRLDQSLESDVHRLWAHAIIGWIFFGFILYMVFRENIYYINLRQAFLLSPMYSNRISQRTVLFTAVPPPYLNETKLRGIYGEDIVKNIWICHDYKEVENLVGMRDKAAGKLEAAEVQLCKTANGLRLKSLKRGDDVRHESSNSLESGGTAEEQELYDKRPKHRPHFWQIWTKKVDTIEWYRKEFLKWSNKARNAQEDYKKGKYRKTNAVFIEFYTQQQAQAAFQVVAHHLPLRMAPRYIGVHPNEIVWSSLKMRWWQKVILRYAVIAFITGMIAFWSLPVALIGGLSHINQLTTTFSWLGFLTNIPPQILGVVTGLLPSVLLSLLMSLVPIIMRYCAQIAGEPTLARIELFTQNAYFAFQLIQVFLVVTIGSSVVSAASQIAQSPTSVLSLLASTLPSASTFYVSYFILQGLAISAGVLSQAFSFIWFALFYWVFAKTPRKKFIQWTNISTISWGSTLPPVTNIAVIGICYSCLAPLVLGFAAVGNLLFYLAYRYNVLYVTDTQIDTKGLIYPRALQQLLTGVYIGILCMIGMFAIFIAIGPLVLMVIFLVFTVLFHISMNAALDPLLNCLPRTLETEEELFLAGRDPEDEVSDADNNPQSASSEKSTGSSVDDRRTKRNPLRYAKLKKPGFIMKFLRPDIYCDFRTMRQLVPHDVFPTENLYSEQVETGAYLPPSVISQPPLLWIARDCAGQSRKEIEECYAEELEDSEDSEKSQEAGRPREPREPRQSGRSGESRTLSGAEHPQEPIKILMTDEGASFNNKNKLVWDAEGSRPPIWEEKPFF